MSDRRFRVSVERSIRSECDLLFFAVGYEGRSRHIAEARSIEYEQAHGIRFGKDEVLSFAENLRWAESDAAVNVSTCVNGDALHFLVGRCLEDRSISSVAIDVSSFPRDYIASAFSGCLASLRSVVGRELSITFLYSEPTFTEPPTEHGPLVRIGAVRPEFAGLGDPGGALAVVLGVGYEPNLALAAQQVLDPADTWLAIPQGLDQRFDLAVEKANSLLIEITPNLNQWRYPIASPVDSFIALESIVEGLRRESNVVMVPLGPKLFTAICLLVVASQEANVGVWRLSAGGLRLPNDQVSTDVVVGISASIVGLP